MTLTNTSVPPKNLLLDDPLLHSTYLGQDIDWRSLTSNKENQDFLENHLGILATSVFRTSLAIDRYSNLIKEQQNRLSAIMSTMDDGILLIDKNGHVVLQNELGESCVRVLCQCEKDDDNKCPIHDWVSCTHTESDSASKELIGSDGNSYQLTYAYHHQQMERVSIRIRQIEKNSEQYTETILPLIRELSAAIAHEINNPLTPVIGLSSTSHINTDTESPETHQKELKTIHRAGQKIADVIHRLLDFDAIHRWRDWSEFSLSVLVDEVWKEFKAVSDVENVHLQNNISTDLAAILSNQAIIRQILLYIFQGIIDNPIDKDAWTNIAVDVTNGINGPCLLIRYENADLPEKDGKHEKESDRVIDTFRDLRILLADLLTRSINGKFTHYRGSQPYFSVHFSDSGLDHQSPEFIQPMSSL